MSSRPRAVDFLDDEDEDNRRERENLDEEAPVYVSEAELGAEDRESGDIESEAEHTEPEPETAIEALPSGAISKGTLYNKSPH